MSLRASAHRNRRCHCEPVRLSGVAIRFPRPPWLPLWGSCHEVTERVKTPSPPLRGTSPKGRGEWPSSVTASPCHLPRRGRLRLRIATPVLRHWCAMTYFYRGWFIIAAPREALIKSARAGSERFCSQARFEKRWNTVCISRFSNRRLRAKDPLSSRRRFIQSFPKTAPFDN